MTDAARRGYLLGLAVTAALVVGYAGLRDLYGRYADYRRNEGEVRALEREIEQLKQTAQELGERKEGLGTNPVEMEAAIRRTKNLVRPGEKVYRVEQTSD
jgi:cell division protein FtsB